MYIEEFIKYLKYEKRYSIHTIVAYTSDLKQYEDFLNQNKETLINTDFRFIRKWISYLTENKISKLSVGRKITTLKSFYKFLLKEEFVDVNPMEKIVFSKTNKKIPCFVEEKDLISLLDNYQFGDDFSGLRNKLILEMFYSTGLRRAELINLESINLDIDNKTLKVLGKRNKERIIPFNNTLLNLIKSYVEIKNTLGLSTHFFFVTEKGKKMYDKLVYRIVVKYLQLCTTIEKKSPHVLRHTFATHMLNHGAELNSIKELLGHSNLAATQIYTHSTFDRLNTIYKQAHPRA